MTRYVVRALVQVSIHTHVEADSMEEAIEAAMEHPMCTIFDGGTYAPTKEWCTSGELDGDPVEPAAEVRTITERST